MSPLFRGLAYSALPRADSKPKCRVSPRALTRERGGIDLNPASSLVAFLCGGVIWGFLTASHVLVHDRQCVFQLFIVSCLLAGRSLKVVYHMLPRGVCSKNARSRHLN